MCNLEIGSTIEDAKKSQTVTATQGDILELYCRVYWTSTTWRNTITITLSGDCSIVNCEFSKGDGVGGPLNSVKYKYKAPKYSSTSATKVFMGSGYQSVYDKDATSDYDKYRYSSVKLRVKFNGHGTVSVVSDHDYQGITWD